MPKSYFPNFEAYSSNTIMTMDYDSHKVKRGYRFRHTGKKKNFENDAYDLACQAAIDDKFLKNNTGVLDVLDSLELIDGFTEHYTEMYKQLDELPSGISARPYSCRQSGDKFPRLPVGRQTD